MYELVAKLIKPNVLAQVISGSKFLGYALALRPKIPLHYRFCLRLNTDL